MRRVRRVLAGCFAAATLMTLPGCVRSAPLEPPRAAPSVTLPVYAIPDDLDVVVRVDLETIRSVLPSSMQSELAAVALSGDPSEASDVVRRALDLSKKVWIGFRPGQDPANTDNVLVLQGSFKALTVKELDAAFKPPRDLGAGWRAYDVRRSEGRSGPARLYTHLEDLWVVASVAELDAVERVIEEGARDRRLEPPERGVVSLSARLPGVVASIERRSPKAARFLSNADVATMSANLDADGLEVFGEMGFVDERAAERAAAALEIVLAAFSENVPESLRGNVTVNTVGSAVTLHARVPQLVLASLMPRREH